MKIIIKFKTKILYFVTQRKDKSNEFTNIKIWWTNFLLAQKHKNTCLGNLIHGTAVFLNQISKLTLSRKLQLTEIEEKNQMASWFNGLLIIYLMNHNFHLHAVRHTFWDIHFYISPKFN